MTTIDVDTIREKITVTARDLNFSLGLNSDEALRQIVEEFVTAWYEQDEIDPYSIDILIEIESILLSAVGAGDLIENNKYTFIDLEELTLTWTGDSTIRICDIEDAIIRMIVQDVFSAVAAKIRDAVEQTYNEDPSSYPCELTFDQA